MAQPEHGRDVCVLLAGWLAGVRVTEVASLLAACLTTCQAT